MGVYTCRACTEKELETIVSMIRNGYTDNEGILHKPNNQVADIIVLEANLGCRIGDIVNLHHDDFICDNGIWKIDITEQKTGKHRVFIVPKPIKSFIDKLDYGKDGRIFSISKPAVWKQMRAVTATLKLKNINTHSMRKMMACKIYENTGHDIEAVCSFLQHSSIDITRHYIRRSDDTIEKAITESISLIC